MLSGLSAPVVLSFFKISYLLRSTKPPVKLSGFYLAFLVANVVYICNQCVSFLCGKSHKDPYTVLEDLCGSCKIFARIKKKIFEDIWLRSWQECWWSLKILECFLWSSICRSQENITEHHINLETRPICIYFHTCPQSTYPTAKLVSSERDLVSENS